MRTSSIRTSIRFGAAAAAALSSLAMAVSATAAPVILNGSFEAGFAAWTRVDQLGSAGSFAIQTGTLSPVNADPVPAPPFGSAAAMSDGSGPGSHVLYQDFVASADNATLSFELFVGNRADRFATPASLDFALTNPIGGLTLNQQARADLLRAGADPFSVAAGDILLSLYSSQVGDALVAGAYRTFSADLSAVLAAHNGESLRLRFAETDNLAQFQFGIDNVRINAIAAIPEPASALLVGVGLAALLVARTGGRRRDRTGR